MGDGGDAQKEPKPDPEEEAGGEQAMDTCGRGPTPPLLPPALGAEPASEARSLENMVMASGKFGGVAGVFLGVHICKAGMDISINE